MRHEAWTLSLALLLGDSAPAPCAVDRGSLNDAFLSQASATGGCRTS